MHPFTDSHVHFWDRSNPDLEWGWLDDDAVDPVSGDDYGELNAQRHLPVQLHAEARFQELDALVHVQNATGVRDAGTGVVTWTQVCDPVEETRWVQALADRSDVPMGIVAYADLTAPEIERVLDEHAESSALRGIRDLRYDGYLSNLDWLRGCHALARHNLVLCDEPSVEDLPAAAALAATLPDLTYCLTHAAFPAAPTSEASFEEWSRGIRRLAAVPSTVVKISGLGALDPDWTEASVRPWILACIEAWGVERAFFGSNWPVDRLHASYADLVQVFRGVVSDFAPHEQQQLLSGNARRVFGL